MNAASPVTPLPVDVLAWDAARHAASMAALNLVHLLDVAEQVVIDAPSGLPPEALAMVGRLGALIAAQKVFAAQVGEWVDASPET